MYKKLLNFYKNSALHIRFISMNENELKQQIASLIRSYPDFPTKGILFRLTILVIVKEH